MEANILIPAMDMPDGAYNLYPIPPPSYPNNYYNHLREFIGVKLDYKLSKDSVYKVGFYASLADTMAFKTSDWGGMFSRDSLYVDASSPAEGANQITNKFIENTNAIKISFNKTDEVGIKGWIKVEAEFTAQGGEQYMYIGCFIDNDSIQWENSENFASIDTTNCGCQGAYFYIDDVYLNGDTNQIVLPTAIKEQETFKLKLYPNPAQDRVKISAPFRVIKKIQITSINGQINLQMTWSNDELLDISNFPSGIYIVSVEDEDGKISTQRLVVAH